MRAAVQSSTRLSIVALGVAITILAASCGGSSGGSSAAKVATLGTSTAGTATATASSSPVSTQDALLAYAKCMRDNGIDMADPTFDANGNPTGRLFGPNSGVNRQAEGFQEAQKACGNLLQGVTLGNGQGGGLDRNAVQASLNDFTACLRDQGLNVNDITFGTGQGRRTGGGGFGGTNGSTPADGSTPAGAGNGAATPGTGGGGGGFGGPPGTGGGTGGGNRGAGFDPTARIISRLGLDATDPAVTKAIAACQSILDNAFRPNSSTTTTTTA